MIRIDKESVRLILKERFYPEDLVLKAMDDFKEACRPEKKGEEITLYPFEENNKEEIGYEFCNYVLGLINDHNKDKREDNREDKKKDKKEDNEDG